MLNTKLKKICLKCFTLIAVTLIISAVEALKYSNCT